MDSVPRRRWVTRRRLTTSLLTVLAVVAGFTVQLFLSEPAAAAPLRTHATARGKFLGYAANAQLLCNNTATCTAGSDATYRNLASTEFNQVTAENVMKWETTEPNDNQYTFTAADGIMAFAAANNQTVHGHTLVWHSQTPGWVQGLPAAQMRTAMLDHIATVAGRYANNAALTSWDVVNEAFNDDGSRRQSFWQNTLGNGYIAEAFTAARAADPNAVLCINDFSIEAINPKSTAIFNLVSQLRQQGVPVGCVGMQAHLIVNQVPSTFQQNIQRFVDLGVQVRITELDIRIPLPADATELSQQASNYTTVVNACLAVTGCAGITLWGIDDGHSWLPNSCCPEGAPLLWNASYQQKPAYTAAHNALDNGNPGDTTPPTAPANLAASGATQTSVNLSWTASTDNVGVTGYDILRAPGATGGTFAVVGTSTTTSTTSGGLTANTTYRFQVRARDAAGNLSAVSNTVQITTPPGGPGGCSVTPTVQTQWQTGYVLQPVTITNTGTTTTTSWTVTVTLPAGHAMTGSWPGNVSISGQTITATNLTWNGTLAPGATATFGFQASRPSTSTALPTSFTCTSS